VFILNVQCPPPVQRPGGQDRDAEGQYEHSAHHGPSVRVPDPYGQSGVGFDHQQKAQNPHQCGGHDKWRELSIAQGKEERARSNRDESVRTAITPHRVRKDAPYNNVVEWASPFDWKNGEGRGEEYSGKRIV